MVRGVWISGVKKVVVMIDDGLLVDTEIRQTMQQSSVCQSKMHVTKREMMIHSLNPTRLPDDE